MSENNFQLRCIEFAGPANQSKVNFFEGVNVVCGSSDTGKSFLAESIDFMLGGSELRQIDERIKYDRIILSAESSNGERWKLERSTSGGGFKLTKLGEDAPVILKPSHSHGASDNLSGFLLEKLDLLSKTILKSSKNSTTQSLSFRNIARLAIVQEDEIQSKGSPFWGGQFTTKTSELATVKLLLTGIDDSSINTPSPKHVDNSGKILLLEDLITELLNDIGSSEKIELEEQFSRLNTSMAAQREALSYDQKHLSESLTTRQTNILQRREIQERLDEIVDLISRFYLLRDHYDIDIQRLEAIRESGSMLVYVEIVPCPMCGADADSQHFESGCDGDIQSTVLAATAEIEKIEKLKLDLIKTIDDLQIEDAALTALNLEKQEEFSTIEQSLQDLITPKIKNAQAEYEKLVELRLEILKTLGNYERIERLEKRKEELEKETSLPSSKAQSTVGIPEIIGNALSDKISNILTEWNFPGECKVHFDKAASDFVIDGKPRGSRGKGLRSITHAAVSLGLLEYAQENDLPHPGFLVIDSPLLAYFKPEGDDDLLLRGSNLKEKFYEYLVRFHTSKSQVIIIENQHPPAEFVHDIHLTVFTNNPSEGRAGFL